MASAIYPTYKESRLAESPSIDVVNDTIKARIVNIGTDYTYAAGHDFIDDVTAYSGTTDQTLANKTVTDGVLDNTADLTFSSVAIDGAKDVEAVVIFKDTGTPATSPVLSYNEFAVAKTPNGGDITVQFHASGIFAL